MPAKEPKFQTIIEPFRIKSVEPLHQSTRAQRQKYLEHAGLNPFLVPSEQVMIDLLTDSGTGAMSTEQWAALMRGDESYAGSPSFLRFEKVLQDLTGCPEIIPTHQGRAAERILFTSLCKPGQMVVSNMLFDTTRANAEAAGCKTLDIPCKELSNIAEPAPFKGNIDLAKLEDALKKHGNEIAMVVMTVTNNSGGGQPASLENIRAASQLTRKHGKPFVIDGCRFAENSWFIKLREPGQANRTPRAIAEETFRLADIISVSAKKDGMANIGGFLTLHNPEWAQVCRNNLILTEGFPTYGGLAGRDLDAIAVGVCEALEEDYLRYRIRSTEYVGQGLLKAGIPIVTPPGGHAIYIDASSFLKHIPKQQFPGWALACGIYEFAGIRGSEIGSVMFGRENADGSETAHLQELVRFAMPRRSYTQSHMDYVVEAFTAFREEAPQLKGVKFTYKPKVLRHFTARFAWV